MSQHIRRPRQAEKPYDLILLDYIAEGVYSHLARMMVKSGTTLAELQDATGYDRSICLSYMKRPIPQSLRRRVFERDGHSCRKCGRTERLCADHVQPWIRGGATTFENLQTLCVWCNNSKRDRIEVAQ